MQLCMELETTLLLKSTGPIWRINLKYQGLLDRNIKVGRKLIQMKTIHDVHIPTHANLQET